MMAGNSLIGKLRSMGLLAETFSYSELQERAAIKTYPWCLVNSCPEFRKTRSRHREVSRDAVDCPHCGYALIWRNKKHEVKTNAEKVCAVPRSRPSKKP